MNYDTLCHSFLTPTLDGGECSFSLSAALHLEEEFRRTLEPSYVEKTLKMVKHIEFRIVILLFIRGVFL